MRTIWKFVIPFPEGQVVMPRGARILALQKQDEIPTIWAEVDPEAPKENHLFIIYGTGHRVVAGTYIGTFQSPPFVWHVYDVTSPRRCTVCG